jgi:predicted nucleic acid-binding protein
MPEVISDTSPLQYLHQTDLLDTLAKLYGQVTIPQAVADELSQGRALGINLPDPSALPWIAIEQVRDRALLPLVTDLGWGEREALALALERPGSLLLLDDALARRYARLLGLVFTGTLGVILRAKQAGYLSSVRPTLDRLDVLRFRLDAATRAAVLKLAGETEP